MMEFTEQTLPTPCYLVEEGKLLDNLRILQQLQEKTGCRILLAQKAFSLFFAYPLIQQYLAGTTASGLFEAQLAAEEMPGKENHVFSPAYSAQEMEVLTKICDHIVFNSFAQWKKWRQKALQAGCQCGLRINPECSTQKHAIYDPCAPGSRLGIRRRDFLEAELDGISGIHFHTLCEQNADALVQTVQAVEKNFGAFLPQMRWINLGGGHHITKQEYDRAALEQVITDLQEKYQLTVYLEPGEAVAWQAGELLATVLDIVPGEIPCAILDASAACHMPDVLEMPYRPEVVGAGKPGEKRYTYQLTGNTCLAGDVIGTYSFDQMLAVGDRITFCDMAHYTMVKNNTFNGMPLPSIIWKTQKNQFLPVKAFGYQDFKQRLS